MEIAAKQFMFAAAATSPSAKTTEFPQYRNGPLK
jgi:hypothetical protein